MNVKSKILIPILGLGHGLNDLIAGYFLGSLVFLKIDAFQIAVGLFVYNLLAFGGQYLVALLMEEIKKPKRFLLIAYTLNIGAVSLFLLIPHLSIVMAGVASAIYHVAGGSICAKNNKATNIGLFAAPGVVGLIFGGFMAYEKINIFLWLIVSAIVFFGFLITIKEKSTYQDEEKAIQKIIFDSHDLIMILLLTVISLRSVIWNVFQLLYENNYSWLIAIAISAFAGKMIGGWLSDKVGWRLYTYTSLLIATPLISFFKNEIVLFCIGIGLLQSSIPATTSLLIHSMKGKTERAIGLSFGAAIIAGAIIFYTPAKNIINSDIFLWFMAFLMIIFLVLSGRKTFMQKSPVL